MEELRKCGPESQSVLFVLCLISFLKGLEAVYNEKSQAVTEIQNFL